MLGLVLLGAAAALQAEPDTFYPGRAPPEHALARAEILERAEMCTQLGFDVAGPDTLFELEAVNPADPLAEKLQALADIKNARRVVRQQLDVLSVEMPKGAAGEKAARRWLEDYARACARLADAPLGSRYIGRTAREAQALRAAIEYVTKPARSGADATHPVSSRGPSKR